jgi:predicted nuclease of predicted toxin-antitoxin system
MSIQLVIDMNLSIEWVAELASRGWSAVHWSQLGDPRATDAEIMAWALKNNHAVFTHDLDFGTMLALSHASGPSILQVRGQQVLPEDIGGLVFSAIRQHERELTVGALVVVDAKKFRIRILPI